jgi:hypothetical protein
VQRVDAKTVDGLTRAVGDSTTTPTGPAQRPFNLVATC